MTEKCLQMRVCICVYVCMYVYICIHIHTYIYRFHQDFEAQEKRIQPIRNLHEKYNAHVHSQIDKEETKHPNVRDLCVVCVCGCVCVCVCGCMYVPFHTDERDIFKPIHAYIHACMAYIHT